MRFSRGLCSDAHYYRRHDSNRSRYDGITDAEGRDGAASPIAAVENEALNLMYIDLAKNSNNWSIMNVTIVNLNVKDLYIMAISVNDRYATNCSIDGERFDISRRVFPATQGKEIQLNFTADFKAPLGISEGEPLTIRAFTSLLNHFERTFKPLTPIVKTRTETEDPGVADRDVLVLDGSDSFDDSAIVSWTWSILDASKTTPAGNRSDAINITSCNYTGKIVSSSGAQIPRDRLRSV